MEKKISKDFKEYINLLVEEIVLHGMPFENKKKYLKKYANTEGIDYYKIEKGIEDFLSLLTTVDKINLRSFGELLYLTPETIDKLLPDAEKNERSRKNELSAIDTKSRRDFPINAKKQVSFNEKRESDWSEALKINTISGYQNFIAKYKEGNYIAGAKQNLTSLEKAQIEKQRHEDEIAQKIKEQAQKEKQKQEELQRKQAEERKKIKEQAEKEKQKQEELQRKQAEERKKIKEQAEKEKQRQEELQIKQAEERKKIEELQKKEAIKKSARNTKLFIILIFVGVCIVGLFINESQNLEEAPVDPTNIEEPANGGAASESAEEHKQKEWEAEDEAWNVAKNEDKSASYRKYISDYPSGRYVSEARSKIIDKEKGEQSDAERKKDESAWQQTTRSDSKFGYEQYVRDYPSGRYVSEARNKIRDKEQGEQSDAERKKDESSWKQATSINTKDAYNQYLLTFPTGLHVIDAKNKIRDEEQADMKGKYEEIYKIVEEMPRFPGCEEKSTYKEKTECSRIKLNEYIYRNLKYPSMALENGIKGQVVLSFIVEKDGYISNIKIVRDIGGGCGDAAVNVIKGMNSMGNKWIPAKEKGVVVRLQYVMPIKFSE